MPSPDPQILRRSLPLVGHFLIAHLGTLIECDPKQVETRHLGISSNWFFAAFSAALVISAVLGPRVGRQIDLVGGRQVLSAPNLILAAGLALRTFRTQLLRLISRSWCVAYHRGRRLPVRGRFRKRLKSVPDKVANGSRSPHCNGSPKGNSQRRFKDTGSARLRSRSPEDSERD
jgi:hypothetical protein